VAILVRRCNPTGKFTVALSSIDLGQGMKSVTRQICAETLGVPVEDVYVDTADSDTGPHCMGSFASRGTHRVEKYCGIRATAVGRNLSLIRFCATMRRCFQLPDDSK
jgi:hypothetical protein